MNKESPVKLFSQACIDLINLNSSCMELEGNYKEIMILALTQLIEDLKKEEKDD